MAPALAFLAHTQPATSVSATNVSRRPNRAALTALTPGVGRAPGPETGVALAEIAETPIGAQHRRPAPEGCQATAESWVRWWVGITASAKGGGFIALFCNKWRRGWDSNPRYACTHNGFRDRPDRPLWHLSGGPLIGGRFRRGNHGQTSAFSAQNQGFPALTWGASCVYSALLRRVIQARRALSCFPAFWAWSGQSPYLLWGGW
jgi:hypothetical protein